MTAFIPALLLIRRSLIGCLSRFMITAPGLDKSAWLSFFDTTTSHPAGRSDSNSCGPPPPSFYDEFILICQPVSANWIIPTQSRDISSMRRILPS